MDVTVNVWAVLMATVAYFALGVAWYWALSKPWAAAFGFSRDDVEKGSNPAIFGLTFVLEAVTVFTLAVLLRNSGLSGVAGGASLGALVGIGIWLPELGLIHHTDQGSVSSLKAGRHLARSGVVGSMGRSRTPADNAVADSFFATLQPELLDRHDWPTRDGLRTAIFDFIEAFYNRRRCHKHLGQVSPDVYERRYREHNRQPEIASP